MEPLAGETVPRDLRSSRAQQRVEDAAGTAEGALPERPGCRTGNPVGGRHTRRGGDLLGAGRTGDRGGGASSGDRRRRLLALLRRHAARGARRLRRGHAAGRRPPPSTSPCGPGACALRETSTSAGPSAWTARRQWVLRYPRLLRARHGRRRRAAREAAPAHRTLLRRLPDARRCPGSLNHPLDRVASRALARSTAPSPTMAGVAATRVRAWFLAHSERIRSLMVPFGAAAAGTAVTTAVAQAATAVTPGQAQASRRQAPPPWASSPTRSTSRPTPSWCARISTTTRPCASFNAGRDGTTSVSLSGSLAPWPRHERRAGPETR